MICACMIVCGLLFLAARSMLMRGCACNPLPACHGWSCDAPLAYNLQDDWPSWPVAAEADRRLPRDNLPSQAAESRWLALHREQVAAAAEATSATKLVFLGDSITEGWVRSGFSGRAPSVKQPQCEAIFRETFGRFRPLNLAIGGDRVQDLGWRLQHGLLSNSALNPPAFLIMIGTNDLGSGEDWKVVADELILVLEQLHARRPASLLLLHAIMPRGGDEGRSPTADRPLMRTPWWGAGLNNHYHSIMSANARLRAYASKPHRQSWLRFLDCSQGFVKTAYAPTDQLSPTDQPMSAPPHAPPKEGRSEPSAAPRRYLPPHLMYDLLHLTPDGYRLWAECLGPQVSEALDVAGAVVGATGAAGAAGAAERRNGGGSADAAGGGKPAAGASASSGRSRRRATSSDSSDDVSDRSAARHAATRFTLRGASSSPDCIGRSCRGGLPGEIDMA